MQLNSSTARTARATLYGCTCGFKAVYASPSLIHQNRAKRWSSASSSASPDSAGPSSQVYFENDNTAEDYHDPAHARMLTARLTKTKKRMVKRGQDFVDKLVIQVKAGKGGKAGLPVLHRVFQTNGSASSGDGGVAFHREKFVERGPPSGGNGGHGGNVYIKPVPHYSSLSHIKKTMLAHNGQAGAGSWLHGRRGNDLVIEVPYGTVIREIRQAQLDQQGENTSGNTSYPEDQENDDENALNETWSQWRKRLNAEKLTDPEATKARRAKMFVLYPTLDEDIELLDNKMIDELEFSFLEEERREKLNRLNKPPVEIDFDEKPASTESEDLDMEVEMPASADKIPPKADEKILLLRGGRGGFGNPYFTQPNSRRSPKLATRGRPGESMRLELELKTLADIGLVGFPNAGKSTVLQALTHSRSVIAPYAFTTMTPQIGTLIIYDDATYSTTTSTTQIEETASRSSLPTGSNRTRLARPANKDARQERLRLTIADCPGLLPNAADNVGLGHDFLRHIERSKVLVYIVDLSGKDPVKDLLVLRQELEEYKPGLSERARIIVANKADKVDEDDEASVQAMKAKLEGIRTLAREWQEADGMERIVIPMSARMRGNVDAFVNTMVTVLEDSNGYR